MNELNEIADHSHTHTHTHLRWVLVTEEQSDELDVNASRYSVVRSVATWRHVGVRMWIRRCVCGSVGMWVCVTGGCGWVSVCVLLYIWGNVNFPALPVFYSLLSWIYPSFLPVNIIEDVWFSLHHKTPKNMKKVDKSCINRWIRYPIVTHWYQTT